MSHLLIVDLPGGNDSDILLAAIEGGHRFTFATADPAHYREQPAIAALLERAEAVLAMPTDGAQWTSRLLGVHEADPFDAVLCLQDLRLVESAEAARAMGLAHVSPDVARLCRDKAAVRERLAGAGLAQQTPFERVEPGADAGARLLAAVERVGLPAIVKPIDGFGSQHVFALRSKADLCVLQQLADLVAEGPGDYGLGIAACGALLVERLHEGPVIGCDVMRAHGQQVLLGVNDKVMAAPPSFAILGGCFTADTGQFADLDRWLGALLDAVGFDFGAAHVELVMTAEGPCLVEINPRLVGARIARLISAARRRSVHADLIALHGQECLPEPAEEPGHAATRWLIAPEEGVLAGIDWPDCDDPALLCILPHASPGDHVRPALDNADRLGCVMTCGPDCARILALADRIVAEARVRLVSRAEASCTG